MYKSFIIVIGQTLAFIPSEIVSNVDTSNLESIVES